MCFIKYDSNQLKWISILQITTYNTAQSTEIIGTRLSSIWERDRATNRSIIRGQPIFIHKSSWDGEMLRPAGATDHWSGDFEEENSQDPTWLETQMAEWPNEELHSKH